MLARAADLHRAPLLRCLSVPLAASLGQRSHRNFVIASALFGHARFLHIARSHVLLDGLELVDRGARKLACRNLGCEKHFELSVCPARFEAECEMGVKSFKGNSGTKREEEQSVWRVQVMASCRRDPCKFIKGLLLEFRLCTYLLASSGRRK